MIVYFAPVFDVYATCVSVNEQTVHFFVSLPVLCVCVYFLVSLGFPP